MCVARLSLSQTKAMQQGAYMCDCFSYLHWHCFSVETFVKLCHPGKWYNCTGWLGVKHQFTDLWNSGEMNTTWLMIQQLWHHSLCHLYCQLIISSANERTMKSVTTVNLIQFHPCPHLSVSFISLLSCSIPTDMTQVSLLWYYCKSNFHSGFTVMVLL